MQALNALCKKADKAALMRETRNEYDERVRVRAHKLWEEAGKPEGHQSDFWFKAEQQLGKESGADDADATVPQD